MTARYTPTREKPDRASAPRSRDLSKVARLVVFRALRLGDMLCAVPALRALKRTFPNARLTLVGMPWAQEFASRFHHYVDHFIAFPGHPAFPEQHVDEANLAAFYEQMQMFDFDLSVQMHGSGEISNDVVERFCARANAGFRRACDGLTNRGHFIDYPQKGPEPLRLLKLAGHLGAPASSAKLEFPITIQDESELRESRVAHGLIPDQYICVHPGASVRSKCWSPENFAKVADALFDEYGFAIVLTGSEKERDLTTAISQMMHAPSINAAAPISIGAMAALMRDARLLVCNDTGVSHIAAGLGLASVVIFSTADMARWAPIDQHLHRCLRDPEGTQVTQVLNHASELLAIL